MSARPRFVWYDLMTNDVEGAKRFYSDVIGWTVDESDGDYRMWVAGKEPVGGLMSLPSDARDAGAPPFWLGYVLTEDIHETVRRAEGLGGKVVHPVKTIPVGLFAVLTDPQAASFALFQPSGGGQAPDAESLGHFSWAELNTTDWKSAWKFYSALFGWEKTSSMEMGQGEYFMFGLDSRRSMGGMSDAARIMKTPPHWLHYVNVRSVDETAKVIAEKGGKIVYGPADIPGEDRIANCQDPQGGVFAIYSSGRKA